jgi:Cu(I)/Ag(I) efflux system protein CusF
MKRVLVITTVLLAAGAPALSQPKADEHSAHHAGKAAAAELTSGEIRKVDSDAAKVTIRHEPIKSLDMPSMTMVFKVKDKSMLDTLKVGDKVKFRAIDDGGALTVTELQREQQ